MWPNSCASTQPNSSTMKTTLSSAAACPPSCHCVPAIQTRKSTKVMWMRTTVPAITAIGKDQSMGISARSWSDQMLGFGSVLSLVYRFSVLCVARLCTQELGFIYRLRALRVVRQDRGGRVAHRMVLDHPDAVERIRVLAMAPTEALSARPDKQPDRGASVRGRFAPSALAWEVAPRGCARRGHGIRGEGCRDGLAEAAHIG